MKLLTVGLVLVTAAVAGCSSTTAGSAGAIQDDVELAAPASAPASSSAGPTSSLDPVASPTDAPSPTDVPDDPALLGKSSGNNSVCDQGLEYKCGDIGQSGVGTVFYAIATPFACGASMASQCNYLEFAPNGWNGPEVNCPGKCGGRVNKTSDWGQESVGTGKGYAYCTGSGANTVIANASGTVIGSGYTNTSAMLTKCNSGNAAEQVRVYTGGGMPDWSLPSWDELTALYYYGGRNAIGGFAPSKYWTSSQYDYVYQDSEAWYVNFGSDGGSTEFKNNDGLGIRAVRAF